MHSHLGLTCHFISDEWKLVSYLVACRQMSGSHTGERITSEFEVIIDKFAFRRQSSKLLPTIPPT